MTTLLCNVKHHRKGWELSLCKMDSRWPLQADHCHQPQSTTARLRRNFWLLYCYAPIWPVCSWTTRLNRIRPPTTVDFNEETIERRSLKIAAHAAWTAAIWFYSHLQKMESFFSLQTPSQEHIFLTIGPSTMQMSKCPSFRQKENGRKSVWQKKQPDCQTNASCKYKSGGFIRNFQTMLCRHWDGEKRTKTNQ